jgi:hypothetical protein
MVVLRNLGRPPMRGTRFAMENLMESTASTRVWVRSLGNACRVRVEGADNAQRLVDRLAQTPALAGLQFVDVQPNGSTCTFQVPASVERTLATLEHELGSMSGVQLMLEPESQ